MGLTTGFRYGSEEDIKNFIESVKKLWQEKGKSKGSESRFKLLIGLLNKIVAFVPTVTTKEGLETIIIWNVPSDKIKGIEDELTKAGIPIEKRHYVWIGEPPNVLPEE